MTLQNRLKKRYKNYCQKEYCQLYPTGFFARTFYRTTKTDKLQPDGTRSNLPLRSIIPNIGTTSDQLVKYLAH